jgi:RNA polymerase-binding protein DksA
LARKLASSTLDRFRRRLTDEREHLEVLLARFDAEREEVRLSETSSDRSPDPNTAEGGSLAFELEKELSLEANARDLLGKVNRALETVDDGTYGICVECGKAIPVARLDALPYVTLCVDCASRR